MIAKNQRPQSHKHLCLDRICFVGWVWHVLKRPISKAFLVVHLLDLDVRQLLHFNPHRHVSGFVEIVFDAILIGKRTLQECRHRLLVHDFQASLSGDSEVKISGVNLVVASGELDDPFSNGGFLLQDSSFLIADVMQGSDFVVEFCHL